MNDAFYSSERNVQILISLMKQHNIRKIIISPGGTNPTLVGSVQQDSFFELYSAVDERSAAYMACGLAAESNEPVALSCTGATASRNYFPGLTEAFYRKLPVLAITSSQFSGKIGNLIPQVTDRNHIGRDIVKLSVLLPNIHSQDEEWKCIVEANRALLELKRNGGGPVHINLETTFNKDFSVKKLPIARKIDRVYVDDNMPIIPKDQKIAVFVGTHKPWNDKELSLIDEFCEIYNAVVLCDHTSNYNGKYKVLPSIISFQQQYTSSLLNIDLLIHIGEISGAYIKLYPKNVWRVSEDGEIRDTFQKLKVVFEMTEKSFFEKYVSVDRNLNEINYYREWKKEEQRIRAKIPELPFSNIWIEKNWLDKLPENSVLHFGILNSLRSANFFEMPENIDVYCNTGGFGIDGPLSTLLGGALSNPKKLHFCVLGDLAFFYDLNSLGNKYIQDNIRILLINNGCGAEFSLNNAHDYNVGPYTAAEGHFGNKSRVLVKNFVENLGFEYIKAETKEEFLNNIGYFTEDKYHNKPLVFETFTENETESYTLDIIENLESTASGKAKNIAKNILGHKGTETVKKIISRR